MARDDTRRHSKTREDTRRHGKAREGTGMRAQNVSYSHPMFHIYHKCFDIVFDFRLAFFWFLSMPKPCHDFVSCERFRSMTETVLTGLTRGHDDNLECLEISEFLNSKIPSYHYFPYTEKR